MLAERFPLLSWEEIEDLCIDFDGSVWETLRWADERQLETVEQEAPRKKPRHDTVQVPKYRTIDDLLALGEDDEAAGRMAPDEVRDTARQLLRDPEAFARFMEVVPD